MKRLIAAVIILIASAAMLIFKPNILPVSFSDSKAIEGRVVKIISERKIEENDVSYIGAEKIQKLAVEIKENGEPRRIEIENNILTVKEGDRVFLRALGDGLYEMIEFSRTRGILWLFVFFVVVILFVSGKKGFNALVGLVFTFAVIFSFIVPQIFNGANPVVVSLIGAIAILVVTLYVAHGFDRKSLAALLGISITLLFTGLLAQYAIHSLNFTGLGSEESYFLNQEAGEKINLVALIIGGIIIAAVGVLDDVAITQASTVFAISSANPSVKSLDLFKKAMKVGKDHISAVINTLILAYTGAALPLVLLLSIGDEVQTGYIASIEIVAEEIVRTLVSSSGLVLAVPITTIISIFLIKKSSS